MSNLVKPSQTRRADTQVSPYRMWGNWLFGRGTPLRALLLGSRSPDRSAIYQFLSHIAGMLLGDLRKMPQAHRGRD